MSRAVLLPSHPVRLIYAIVNPLRQPSFCSNHKRKTCHNNTQNTTDHLPALYDAATNKWTSGYSAITTYLQQQRTPTTSTTPTHPDSTAYTAYLTAHAAPLLALYLYVSSANWSAATRPAYSSILPFPLPWTEPPAIRAAMTERSAHLGMSSLDTDALADKEQRELDAAAKAGWITVPESLKLKRRTQRLGDALAPEDKGRIRLEAMAREVFDVLEGAGLDWEEEGEEDGERKGLTMAVRCLAFGYLGLMMLPDGLPRPWLREVLTRGEGGDNWKYEGLCRFVRDFRGRCFGSGVEELPWATITTAATSETKKAHSTSPGSSSSVVARFVRGVLHDVPSVGEVWSRWWAERRKDKHIAPSTLALSRREREKRGAAAGTVLVAGAGLAVLAAATASIYMYRELSPFGAPHQYWQRPSPKSFGALGAVGALFAGAYGEI